MSLRNFLLIATMIFMLMLSQNILTSQEEPEGTDETKENDDDIIGEDEYEENKTQIENPNTKEEIAKALRFFERANRTQNEDSALNDRIEGMTRLQEILTQEEYRADVVYNPIKKIYQGARVYVRNLLEDMSDEILELYKSRYEKIASDMINNAIFNKDIEILMKGVRTYPFTNSAVTGAIQGARILIEQSKLTDAIALIYDLIHLKSIDDVDRSSLVSQLAFCYRNLLWVYELEKLLQFAREKLPEARINLGHKFVDLSTYVEDMLKDARKSKKSPSYSETYPKDGGNLANSKIVQAIVNPDNIKWSKDLPSPIIGSRHTYNSYGYGFSSYSLNINPIYPAVSKDTIYVPYRSTLIAYNLYSGAEQWSFRNQLPLMNSWISDVDNAVIYTATCDDNNVYAPIESYVPTHMIPNDRNPYSYSSTPSEVIRQKRELICFDKHTGDIRWRVGAKWDNSLPLHMRLSYPLAPVIIDNKAYVVGCTVNSNAHFFLAAFDVKGEIDNGKPTGDAKLLWISKVATGQQETNMFGNPIREPIPLGIAYNNNRVIVCSNIGIIGAFDSSTGERVWAQLYDRIPYISRKTSYNQSRRTSWFNRPPIIYKDKVFIAPLDSSKVYCYDLYTGKLLWFYRYNPYSSWPSRYIIGVYDNKLFFGGTKYLYAVDIDSGKLKNALDIREESRVNDYVATGKPVIMGNICVIPTRTALIQIDLNEVKVVKVNSSDVYSHSVNDIASMGGNLLCAENAFISVNASTIAVAYNIDNLLANLIELEKEFPEDIETKFKIGVLLVENNKTEEAIVYFKKILEEKNKLLVSKFHHIMVQSSRKLYSIYYDRALSLYYGGDLKELDAYIALTKGYAQTTKEHVQLLLLDIRSNQRSSSDKTYELLDQLREKYPDFVYDYPQGEMPAKIYACLDGAIFAESQKNSLKAVDYWQNLILYQPNVKYMGQPLYKYAVKRIDLLINEFSRKVYEKWDKVAEELYQKALKDDSIETLETVIDGYPNSTVCEKAFYELILMFIRSDQNHDAVISIQEFLGKYSSSEKRPELMLRLYDIYNKTEVLFSARNLLKDISKEFKGQKIQYGSKTIDIDSFVNEQLALEKFKNLTLRDTQPTMNTPPLKLKFQKEFYGSNHSRFVNFSGRVPKEYANQLYITLSQGLVYCVNADNGEELWTANLSDSYQDAFYINKNLLMITRSGMLNINPKNGEINWQHSFTYNVEKIAVGDGILAIIGFYDSKVTRVRVYSVSFYNIDDGRVLSDFQFEKIQTIRDAKFYNKTLLILTDNGIPPNPSSIIAFNTDDLKTPIYEITLNDRLLHSNLIVTADKNIVALTQRMNLLRIFDLETGESKKTNKVLKSSMWNTQNGNEKIFVSGVNLSNSNRAFRGYDPDTFEQKWEIQLKNVFAFQNYEIDEERISFFYRTSNQKYIVEEYDIISGKQLMQYEVVGFNYERNEYLDMLVTQNYVIAIRSVYLGSSGSRKYKASLCIVDKKTGKSVQYIDFVPRESDTARPMIYVLNNRLLIHSNSLACYNNK